MIGKVILFKTKDNKIVPGVCLKILSNGYILAAQLRSTTEKDIMMKKSEKNSKLTPIIFHIGKPEGLKDNSVIMLLKVHQITQTDIKKEIAQISFTMVQEALGQRKRLLSIQKLHEELHLLKKKIKLAQFNNEKYDKYEERLYQLLHELGYDTGSKRHNNHSEKGYKNFREVPNKGYIKVYLGGR